MGRVTVVSAMRSADQSRVGGGTLVGRRSSVSSWSALWASCAIDHPSARNAIDGAPGGVLPAGLDVRDPGSRDSRVDHATWAP
jgi:hypothetical protein